MTQPHNLEATVCVYEHQKTGEVRAEYLPASMVLGATVQYPAEDKCTECGATNCMLIACPECGGRYWDHAHDMAVGA